MASKMTIDDPFIHRLQARHFIIFDALPLLAVLALPFYFNYLLAGPFELALFGVFWLITGLGITVGYHRLFTHRSFTCAKWLKAGLAIAASMSAQGGIISWVAIHRLHHETSDCAGDPHSPNRHGEGFYNRLRGLLHSHLLWMAKHSYPNVIRYAPDILRDPQLSKINRQYHFWVFVGLAIPTILGAAFHQSLQGAVSGFFWGGVFRIFVLEHIIWAINSFLHRFGSRAYETREHSHNSALLSIVTLGESWHNNHHRFANSPHFGLTWTRPDPGYWFIKAMQSIGAAWDLSTPTKEEIAARRNPRL